MRRHVLVALVALVYGCGPSAPPEPFFGDWKVSSTLTPGTSAVAPDAARSAVGTAVSFGGRSARYGERTCSGPTYTRRWLASGTFTETYRVDPAQLALTGSQVELVDITCTSGSLDQAATVIVRGDGTMLTVWDGVFYVLVKA